VSGLDKFALACQAAFWDRIQNNQPIADEYNFGDQWRALVETRTMEAARAADFRVHLARLGVDDDGDDADALDEMQKQTFSVIHDLQRKVAA
jgi:hypothetical protein